MSQWRAGRRLLVRGAPGRVPRARRPRDDHAHPRADRGCRARRGLGRRRRPRPGRERRGCVDSGGSRLDARHGAVPLRRDHARGPRPEFILVDEGVAVGERHASPSSSWRAGPAGGGSGSTASPSTGPSACAARRDAGRRSRRPRAGTPGHARVQRVRLPLRARLRLATAAVARGGRSSRDTASSTARTRCAISPQGSHGVTAGHASYATFASAD